MHRLPLALASAIAVTCLSGCATPTFSVRSAAIDAANTEDVRVSVEIELANPADDSMHLLQWSYVFRSGEATYQGTWEALLTLPPNNVMMTSRIPCVVPAAAFDASQPWTISGSLTYRSPARISEILYDAGIVRPSAGFSGGGESVAAAKTASAGSVR